MANENSVRRIEVKVSATGDGELKKITAAMGNMNKSVSGLSSTLNFLRSSFAGIFAAMGVGEIIAMSDAMQNAHARISILTGSTQAATGVIEDLRVRADRTKTSVNDLAEIYARLAQTTQTTKLSQEEMLDVTEILQNSFRLSGATTAEATNTIIQLSQAFSSGQLRGQELRSVLEQNAVLAGKLRQVYGQNIFKKAEEGAISAAGVLKILFENQEEINGSAKKMSATFGQTVTVAMNSFKLAIFDINKELGLSSKFATVMEFTIQNIEKVIAVTLALATTAIPFLIAAIFKLGAAIFAFTKKNLLLLAIQAVLIVIILCVEKFETFNILMLRMKASAYELAAAIYKVQKSFFEASGTDTTKISQEIKFLEEKGKNLRKEAAFYTNLAKPVDEIARSEEDRLATIKKLEALDRINQSKSKKPKLKDELGALNKQVRDNVISLDMYNRKLDEFELKKLNNDIEKGTIDWNKYKLAINEIEMRNLNRDLRDGAISLEYFNARIRDSRIEELDLKLQQGVLTLKEYNTELNKLNDTFSFSGSLSLGVSDYVESIGTLSQGIANGISNTFKTLEESLTSFVMTGKFNFEEFTKAVLEDLTRIILRAAVLGPLAQSMQGLFTTAPVKPGTGGGGGGNLYSQPLASAKGNAFENGVHKFARGGLVSSPTLFGYGGGKTGLMGEAGTEAILPLKRGSDGNLGVRATTSPVVVNIINNNGSDVTQTEGTGPNGERTIEIMIDQKVKEGIVRGKYDKAMQSSYGLQRKGG